MDISEMSKTYNVKNRMRELRSSGSVRDEGGNTPRLLGRRRGYLIGVNINTIINLLTN